MWNNPLSFKDPNGKQGVPGVGIAIDISIWLGTHLVPGGFIYYGNWGGPGWTRGQTIPYEDLTPQQQSNLAPQSTIKMPATKNMTFAIQEHE